MGTEKQKITSYVPDWVKSKIQELAELEDQSESKTIEATLIKALDPDSVIFNLKREFREKLIEWAEDDVRDLKGQMQWLIERAIAEHFKIQK